METYTVQEEYNSHALAYTLQKVNNKTRTTSHAVNGFIIVKSPEKLLEVIKSLSKIKGYNLVTI